MNLVRHGHLADVDQEISGTKCLILKWKYEEYHPYLPKWLMCLWIIVWLGKRSSHPGHYEHGLHFFFFIVVWDGSIFHILQITSLVLRQLITTGSVKCPDEYGKIYHKNPWRILRIQIRSCIYLSCCDTVWNTMLYWPCNNRTLSTATN